MGKSDKHSLMTTANSKNKHSKGHTTSLQITRPQDSKGPGRRKQKDCPSTTQHPMSIQSQCAYIKMGTSGSQEVQSVTHSIHTASQISFKATFLKDSFRIAVFLTCLIKGHSKNPKRQLNQHETI